MSKIIKEEERGFGGGPRSSPENDLEKFIRRYTIDDLYFYNLSSNPNIKIQMVKEQSNYWDWITLSYTFLIKE